MFSSLRQDYRERLRRRSRRYTGQPFPKPIEPTAETSNPEATAEATSTEPELEATPEERVEQSATVVENAPETPPEEHPDAQQHAAEDGPVAVEPEEAGDDTCASNAEQPEAVEEEELEAAAECTEHDDEDDELGWDVDAMDNGVEAYEPEPMTADADEVDTEAEGCVDQALPLPLDEALEAGQDSGVLIALHREVSDIADRIFRGVNGRQPEVWAAVRQSDWYSRRRRSLGLEPLEEFYTLVDLAYEELHDGTSGTELRDTLADLEFSRLLLSLRDVFVKNIPSWGRRQGWWSD
jgi:hypothetical protein